MKKLLSKEVTAVEIAQACQVDSSVVYQWKLDLNKNEAKRREAKKREKPPIAPQFVEIVQVDENTAELESNSGAIVIRLKEIEINVPADYQAAKLACLCKELSRR